MPLKKFTFLKILFLLNSCTFYAQDIKEEIIVTGTLNPNLEVPSAVLQFTDTDLKIRGVFRIEDFLNNLTIIDLSLIHI